MRVGRGGWSIETAIYPASTGGTATADPRPRGVPRPTECLVSSLLLAQGVPGSLIHRIRRQNELLMVETSLWDLQKKPKKEIPGSFLPMGNESVLCWQSLKGKKQ